MKTLSITQPPSPPTTSCRTRYGRDSHCDIFAVCFTNVGMFSEGETYMLECKNATCSKGVSVYTASAVAECSAPFTMESGVGCVYMMSTNMTWCDARVFCTDLGGDLYVPANFTALQYYLLPYAYKNVWVGVRDQKWLNGNAVTTAEWATGKPNDMTIYTCSRMVPSNSLYNLDDTTCFKASFVSLCQRQVPGM
nr:uncharacterized protein LOC123745148 [Procambarus clarkii]